MTFAEFIRLHPRIRFDNADKLAVKSYGIDLAKLHEAIGRSSWLKRAVRLGWLIRSYADILSGKYDDYPKRSLPACGHYSGERKYTKAQLDSLIDDIDSIEF